MLAEEEFDAICTYPTNVSGVECQTRQCMATTITANNVVQYEAIVVDIGNLLCEAGHGGGIGGEGL